MGLYSSTAVEEEGGPSRWSPKLPTRVSQKRVSAWGCNHVFIYQGLNIQAWELPFRLDLGVTETGDGATIEAPALLLEGMGGGGSETLEDPILASFCLSREFGMPSTGGASDTLGGDVCESSWSLSKVLAASVFGFLGSRGSSWQRWPIFLFTQRIHGRSDNRLIACTTSAIAHV